MWAKKLAVEKDKKSQNFFKIFSSSVSSFSLSLFFSLSLSSLSAIFLSQKRERDESFFFDRNEIHLPLGMKEEDDFYARRASFETEFSVITN